VETPARVIVGAFATIAVLHYIGGGRAQLGRWLDYVFTGRTPDSATTQASSTGQSAPAIIPANQPGAGVQRRAQPSLAAPRAQQNVPRSQDWGRA
jgi:hypothetical protein